MRKKIDVQYLEVGMYVAELDRPWLGTPFLFQGFEIQAREEIGAADTRSRLRREEAGNDAFALGDVDFFAFAKKVFHGGETVAQITDRSFLHVMHFSITRRKWQENPQRRPVETTRPRREPGGAGAPGS